MCIIVKVSRVFSQTWLLVVQVLAPASIPFSLKLCEQDETGVCTAVCEESTLNEFLGLGVTGSAVLLQEVSVIYDSDSLPHQRGLNFHRRNIVCVFANGHTEGVSSSQVPTSASSSSSSFSSGLLSLETTEDDEEEEEEQEDIDYPYLKRPCREITTSTVSTAPPALTAAVSSNDSFGIKQDKDNNNNTAALMQQQQPPQQQDRSNTQGSGSGSGSNDLFSKFSYKSKRSVD